MAYDEFSHRPMKSKQQKELEFAQNVLNWDKDYINQDENRTWILLGDDVARIEELYYDPGSQLFHFFGTQIINEHSTAYQRWFNDQEKEIFDPTLGFIVLLEEPEELFNSLLQQEALNVEEDSSLEFLEWNISTYARGKQWIQRLESGLYFALRVDECNLVHYEITPHPKEAEKKLGKKLHKRKKSS